MTVSDAQKRANKKWNDAHREQVRISNYRSRAKSFIKKYANLNDLKEIERLLNERKSQLK